MAMKQLTPTPVKPIVPVRYFQDKETGVIHEADANWAPVMACRTDLKEVTTNGENSDEETV